MLTYQALHDAAADYNRQFQELTARIYEDGFVSCQEATEGTRYYKGIRPRLRRFHRAIRTDLLMLYQQQKMRVRQAPQTSTEANDVLRPYHTVLHEFDKLMNDSQVMLKIFADVLNDCSEDEKTS
jgi:hypothetical protein